MKRPSRTSNNRALLVLCALGLLCASSSLVSAQDGRTSKSERGAADFDGDYSGKMKSKEKKNKPVVRPEGKRDPSPARPGIDTQSAKGSGRLTVRKILIPGNDPGKFNLIIDGVVKAFAVGHNGTTGTIVVNTGAHNVGEMAGTSITNLANYTTVIGGDCSPNGNVSLAADQHKTCTITNTRKKPPTPLTEVPFQPGGPLEVPPVQPHGSWTQGPGTYTFKVCAEGTTGAPCNIKGAPGQSIRITIEGWGGGGGGGSGAPSGWGGGRGGYGGGGGGGGAYAKTIITAVVPSSGALVYYVNVGAGGAKGQAAPALQGGQGGFTKVSTTTANPTNVPPVIIASGGWGGQLAGGAGGNGMIGFTPGAIGVTPGSAGGNGGSGNTCNGHAGGGGGSGGGPGNVNNGGAGGHGGYFRKFPSCMADDNNDKLSEGNVGGNGKVTFVW